VNYVKSRTLACLLAMTSPLACWGPTDPHLKEIELGVDVRLNAVESHRDDYVFIAVGSDGTVVHQDGRTWDLGDVELRDIQCVPGMDAPSLWMVVGDLGTIIVGSQPNSDADIEWMVQESGTTANLYGIAVHEGTMPIVVGDQIVLVGQPTAEWGIFEWDAEPVPPGGWGRLRDVEVEDGAVRAVGLQGRMWVGSSEFFQWNWHPTDAGTDEDLFDICMGTSGTQICGTRGTIVSCDWLGDLDDCTSKSVGEYDLGRAHRLLPAHPWRRRLLSGRLAAKGDRRDPGQCRGRGWRSRGLVGTRCAAALVMRGGLREQANHRDDHSDRADDRRDEPDRSDRKPQLNAAQLVLGQLIVQSHGPKPDAGRRLVVSSQRLP
jgi:hypothetical protein